MRRQIISLIGSLVRVSPLGRQKTYALLPKRAQMWLREIPLPDPLRIAAPIGRQILIFSHSDESIAYPTYFWQGMTGVETATSSYVLANGRQYAWFCDVGAHIGHFSILFRLANPESPIKAIEANPTIAKTLRRNLDTNGIEAEIIEAVVCAKVGTVDFYLPPPKQRASLPGHASIHDRFGTAPIKLPGMTLSTILNDLSEERGLIKIDAEGAEADILEGSLSEILHRKPDLILEVIWPPECDLTKAARALSQVGYEFLLLHNGTPIDLSKPIEREALPWQKDNGSAAWGEVIAVASRQSVASR